MDIQNQALFDLKKTLAVREMNSLGAEFKFQFHDLILSITTDHIRLKNLISDSLPKKWLSPSGDAHFQILHKSPKDYDLDDDFFENETDSHCYIEESAGQETAIQRDFVATKKRNKVKAIFSANHPDGFHNFLRWLISRELLEKNSAIIHSSAILGKNGLAYVFLGPSGAGKTTTCYNADQRKILADDMNYLHFDGTRAWISPGAIGGRFLSEVEIDNRYEVVGFYWLEQSNHLSLEPNSSSVAAKRILSSIANIFWSNNSLEISSMAMKLAINVAKVSPCYTLQLKNDSTYWEMIENPLLKIPVSGNSMSPTFYDGDVIEVIQDYDLKLGHIYLYRDQSKSLIAHRLISLNPITFKGDFEINHEVIHKEDIIGQVCFINQKKTKHAKLSLYLTRLNYYTKPRIVRFIARAILKTAQLF